MNQTVTFERHCSVKSQDLSQVRFTSKFKILSVLIKMKIVAIVRIFDLGKYGISNSSPYDLASFPNLFPVRSKKFTGFYG